MTNKEFKILSIDGGGIKGLYTSKILTHLEEEYQCHLSDHFDMICGTSTGGIIALALSLKIPAKEILAFYRTDGPKIFKYHSKLSRKVAFLKQLIWKSKYPNENLKDALIKVFKETQIKDSNNLLCIPSFNVTIGKNRVFKKNHTILRGDDELSMVDVALATSAAPTYFPMHKIDTENAYYIDGGIWANNPALCGLREALKYFVPEQFQSIKILSISSLNHSNGFHLDKKWFNSQDFERQSFGDWGGKLFQVTLDGQSEFVSFILPDILKSLICPAEVITIPSHEISPDNVSCINLDMATKKSIDVLLQYGHQQGLKHRTMQNVKQFFEQPKQFNF